MDCNRRILAESRYATMPDEPPAPTQATPPPRGATGGAALPIGLTALTLFLIATGYSFNLGQIWIWNGRWMASDYTHWAFGQWPVLPFAAGTLYGATVIQWVRVHPWMALIATFMLSHLAYPLR